MQIEIKHEFSFTLNYKEMSDLLYAIKYVISDMDIENIPGDKAEEIQDTLYEIQDIVNDYIN